MRLLARVLHSSGIVQNCYAEPAWGSRWINTKAENGGFKARFMPYNSNEMNFCKDFSYKEKAIWFNYNGAKVPIEKYYFGNGQAQYLFYLDKDGFHKV